MLRANRAFTSLRNNVRVIPLFLREIFLPG